MAQSQEVRRERKRQRRAQRKLREARGWNPRWNDVSPEEEPGVVVVVSRPGGRIPAEIELPATRLSDSLVTVVEEFIPWPPGRDELGLLEAWLRLGARVWNSTLVAERARREDMREPLVSAASRLSAEADGRAIVEEIAERKRRLFPTDERRVLDVHVTVEKGRAIVHATGGWYTR